MDLADAPTTTDWITAWTGALSLLVAAAAFAATILLLRHEILVRREEKEDLDATQARLVLANVLLPDDEVQDSQIIHLRWSFDALRWHIHNYSEAAIVDVQIAIGRRPASGESRSHRNADPDVELMSRRIPVVEPGGHVEEEIGLGSPVIWLARDKEPPSRRFYTALEFTDAGGRLWRRVGSSAPQRIRQGLRPTSLSVEMRSHTGSPMTADDEKPR